MDVWNYILGYRNTLKSVFETWVVHIPFKSKKKKIIFGKKICYADCSLIRSNTVNVVFNACRLN